MSRRTYVFIDGFNLYHGAVKNRPELKWLDLVALSKRLMGGYDVIKVKYFTAKVRELGDPERPSRQLVYWRSLKELYPDEFDIIEGFFRIHPKRFRLATRRLDGTYYASRKSVMVMKPEEKGADVNLAVHLVNDAWKDVYDVALVISNDSDLSEAIRISKFELEKKIILANQFLWSRKGIARELYDMGLDKRRITEQQLKACQLPNRISGTNLKKPDSW